MRRIAILTVLLALAGCRGKELGRVSLRGEASSGFEGRGTYPAKTKRIHLYYDAAWTGSKELPEGSLTLEAPGRTVTCPLKPDGAAVCGYTGSGGEFGAKRQDCERPSSCTLEGAADGEVRARVRFNEPARIAAVYRLEVVFRE